MSEFSQLLTDYVHRKNVRIYSLAEYCGIDRSLMYKIIHGKRMPSSASAVDKISEFLQLTPAEHRELHTTFRISLKDGTIITEDWISWISWIIFVIS